MHVQIDEQMTGKSTSLPNPLKANDVAWIQMMLPGYKRLTLHGREKQINADKCQTAKYLAFSFLYP